jgi:hypothetical protein
MGKVTQVTASRIAVVFDFDETLTPKDSFAALLEDCGLNVEEFKNRVQSLVDQGWEKYLARAYCLVKASGQLDHKITQSKRSKYSAIPGNRSAIWSAAAEDSQDRRWHRA